MRATGGITDILTEHRVPVAGVAVNLQGPATSGAVQIAVLGPDEAIVPQLAVQVAAVDAVTSTCSLTPTTLRVFADPSGAATSVLVVRVQLGPVGAGVGGGGGEGGNTPGAGAGVGPVTAVAGGGAAGAAGAVTGGVGGGPLVSVADEGRAAASVSLVEEQETAPGPSSSRSEENEIGSTSCAGASVVARGECARSEPENEKNGVGVRGPGKNDPDETSLVFVFRAEVRTGRRLE